MTFEIDLPKMFARAAAVAIIAIGASACSSVPTWVNPTNWIGSDDDATTASNATPDLAGIPDKPAAPSTVDERTQVADSLKADRASAQYSADALRGGTEPSAAPPSDTPASDTTVASLAPTAAAPATPPPAAPAPSEPAAAPQTAPAADVPAPAHADNAAPAQQPAAPAEPAPPATQVASVPASDAPATMPSDEQLGFEASKAPALDPNVAHFVAPAVLNQYQQTSTQAASAPALTPPPAPKADVPQKTSELDPSATARSHRSYAAATPEHGSSYGSMASPAAFTAGSNAGSHAVVFFPRDAAVLGPKAREQVAATARAYLAAQGTGFVRIVGHSSSRTADMPLAQHLEVVFQHSQDFATAVAQELIRDGIPADKVLVEAVGDSQPVYFESMPQGEAGNRRAEIFL
jgi:outer membrane protein OmpA-like peptidoglycan-associated protein